MDRCMIDSFDPPDLYSFTVVDYDRNRRTRIDAPLIVTGGDSARIRCADQIILLYYYFCATRFFLYFLFYLVLPDCHNFHRRTGATYKNNRRTTVEQP